ncbi:MAG TPA: AzlD domain-containing protein, partial [Desulfobacterales bacterium]|nr:AzlD domain-containing protein [Desulfobacterales bacterium]
EREKRGASGMTANEGWMIAGMMAVTFGIRYFLFALAGRIRMAPWIEASLKFIPPAVLTGALVGHRPAGSPAVGCSRGKDCARVESGAFPLTKH